MSRSGYVECDDAEDMRRLNLYRGRIASATRGKRGQQFFKDMVAALDAMPEKWLTEEVLETEDGDVCALGALSRFKGLDNSTLDSENHDQLASVFNVAPCLIAEVEWENDEAWGQQTPEQRWQRVRSWAEKQVQQPKETP